MVVRPSELEINFLGLKIVCFERDILQSLRDERITRCVRTSNPGVNSWAIVILPLPGHALGPVIVQR